MLSKLLYKRNFCRGKRKKRRPRKQYWSCRACDFLKWVDVGGANMSAVPTQHFERKTRQSNRGKLGTPNPSQKLSRKSISFAAMAEQLPTQSSSLLGHHVEIHGLTSPQGQVLNGQVRTGRRAFWICASTDGRKCSFFDWAEEAAEEGPEMKRQRLLASPKCSKCPDTMVHNIVKSG